MGGSTVVAWESHWITKDRKNENTKGKGLRCGFGQHIFIWAIRERGRFSLGGQGLGVGRQFEVFSFRFSVRQGRFFSRKPCFWPWCCSSFFIFVNIFLFRGSDSSQRASDKTGLQEITDHLMVAGPFWTGSPGPHDYVQSQQTGAARRVSAPRRFSCESHLPIAFMAECFSHYPGAITLPGCETRSRATDCRNAKRRRFQPSDMGRIGASQGRRGWFSPGGQGPVECTLRSWFSPSAAGRRRNRGRGEVYIFTVVLSRLFRGFLQNNLD
jgi:hypothetical protein